MSRRAWLRLVSALVWRESRASLRRGLLIVASVAIGTGALVAINSFTDSLRDSVRRQARALFGADLAVWSPVPFGAATESVVDDIRSATRPRAELARVVSFGAMALVPGGTSTRLVQVLAVDPGYPLYGGIETAPAGEWPRLAETGGAIVDPALLASLGARVGDELALGEARFWIRATIASMPGEIGIRSAIGPRVVVPRRRVAETRLLGLGSRARYEAFFRLPPGVDAQKIADRFRARVSSERVGIRTYSEDQRQLSQTLGRFGAFLSLVALVALLLGGLGVASAVHVLIQRRLPTIAILRCLGASSRTILAVYLLQAAAVGLVGSLLGALLGGALQLVLPPLLRDLLPVDVGWSVSWRAVLGGIGIGVWVALVFSLPPLLAIRRISPLAVLRRDDESGSGSGGARRDPARLAAVCALVASVAGMAVLQAGDVVRGLAFAGGVGGALGVLGLAALLLVRGLRRFFPSRLPYLQRQGLANLYRPGNQTLTVMLALGFGVFLLSTLLLVQHNLLRELRVDHGAERPNVVVFDVQPDQQRDVEARIRAFGSVAAPAVPIVPMRLLSLKGRAVSELLAIADPTQRPERWALRREYRSSYRDAPNPSERIVAGAWWRPGDWRDRSLDATLPVALEASLARELRVGLGDEILWDVQGVSVRSRVACLREVAWVRFEPNFFVVFPDGPLREAPQSEVVLSRIEDANARARLQRDVVEAHPNVSTLDLSQVQHAIEDVLDRVALAIRFMALFSLAAGAVVLAGAVATSRSQQLREGALLRALGATRSQLVRILLAEYLVLGTLAAGTAILLATLAGWALVGIAYDGTFALPGPSLFALLLVVAGLTIMVGLYGSGEVWRRPPLEVLRTE